ncbi:MAG: oxalate:formate antiporter, partial [Acidobacteria bacterium]|nr:oxalate:formate antiporter [Acidobacteriota bacterium]
GAAGVLGPKLGGRIYDQFQSYTRAFDIAAVLLVVSFVIIVTLKPPRKDGGAS